jgi:hypothetical protein
MSVPSTSARRATLTHRGGSTACADWPLSRCSGWSQQARAIHAQAVVVELGYRDEFDWRINGRVEHIGQPAFDANLRKQIDQYVKVLGRGGTQVVFLSVPFTHPPALSDGSPARPRPRPATL